ncbi:DNA helicase PcrA [Carboxydocella sp. JDF658]|uniref:DNA helicase PcrA n=1 Tax=Carboxydocella sp. JDF658 TaxID=1926600 RepID=UPI0009AD9C1A|nr:DNA helicase PcrA [Carboxydocella sp. JDF658]GAW31990.1 ATP-dependent DNA helicase PcrA [Carboxydocella sp. JDF658]
MADLLANLNPVQREAVTHINGPLLILAGAGSGKTRVLTHRIAYLIRQGVKPWQILAITFTNKAAGEMKERVEQLVGEVISRDMWVSTFHSACLRILRREISYLGYDSNFVIYDTADQQTVLKECLRELNLDEKKYSPRLMAALISDAKNRLETPAQMRRRVYGDWLAETASRVYESYQQKLIRNQALDFDDLIMLTVQLFEEFPEILAYYQQKFLYILVDEYQDTNHAQYRLVNLLASAHRNLCVVGDDDQSIYRFRGADIGNILDFERDYPEAKVIKLEQNYRSTRTILAAANAVVANNVGRKDKSLWTENPAGEPIVCVQLGDEKEEARFIVGEILRLNKNGRPYSDFAVLYRTNAQSRAIEDELIGNAIPYTMVGGLKFYERKEIKDVLAYLRVLVNPADSVSLERIINVPKRNIGEATVNKIRQEAARRNLSLYQALMVVEEIPGLSARSQKAVRDFINLMEDLRRQVEIASVTEMLDAVLERTGYQAELEAEKTVEAQTRLENLREFRTVTMEFDARQEEEGLEGFLAGISLMSDLDTLESGEQVTLMTLHSAKGLEFPVVFLAGMEEGIFPHSRALLSLEEAELEEERRLCYVGITRAKEKLYLTHCWSRNLFGRISTNPPSRFLSEIPAHLLERGTGASRSGVDRLEAGAASTSAQGSTAAEQEWQLGDRVVHKKYGPGAIVGIKGQGEDTELSIAFPNLGIKVFIAKYAPIRKEQL